MRVTTRAHGLFDYGFGLILLMLPVTLGFGDAGAPAWVPMSVGALVIANALVTDFEMGVLRHLQIPVHLWIDGILGLLLGLAPWLLAFDREGWLPHAAAGVVLIAVAFLTNTVPGYDRRGAGGAAVE